METHLRPMTLGEILDRTAQLYRSNFLLFAGIFSFYAAVTLVLNLAHLGILAWMTSNHRTAHLTLVSVIATVLQFAAMILLLGAAIAAISRAVASVHLGEPITIREAYRRTFPRLGRYLGLMSITGIIAYGPFAALYGATIAVTLHYRTGFTGAHAGAASSPAQQQALMAMGVAFLVLFVIAIPVAAYTIWMNLRYSLAVPACVVEDIKAWKAVQRSVELTKGAKGRIFLLGLLVAVIKLGLIGLTQSFLVVLAIKHHGQLSLTANSISQVITFFTNTFLGPIGATGITLFYYDQRVRKDGFDIEWMMQAAGMTPPAIPAEAHGSGEPA